MKSIIKANYLIIHPILFALYLPLHLFAANLGYMRGGDVWWALLVMLVWVVVSWSIWILIFRNIGKAAIAASTYTLLFWSYSQIYDFITRRTVRVILNSDSAAVAAQLISHRYVIGGLLVLMLGLFLYLLFSQRSFRRLTITLNWISVIAFVMPGLAALNFAWDRVVEQEVVLFQTKLPPLIKTPVNTGPDIYYLIFDRFASTAVASNYYNCDLSDLDAFLEHKGFCVLKQSHCNYLGTALSLSSSLNMQYWDDQILRLPSALRGSIVMNAFQKNRVALFLRRRDYAYINIGDFWPPTSRNSLATININHCNPVKNDLLASLLTQTMIFPYFIMHYQSRIIKANLIEIKKSALQPSPKFVFSHLLIPHDPYWFKADGTPMSRKDQAQLTADQQYGQQLLFTKDQIKDVVDAILRQSAQPPIIVLQSDEGPRVGPNYTPGHLPAGSQLPEDPRHIQGPILNALYLPGFDYAQLHPDMTPVNTFRLILTHYFKAQLELLEDRPPLDYLPVFKQTDEQ